MIGYVAIDNITTHYIYVVYIIAEQNFMEFHEAKLLNST